MMKTRLLIAAALLSLSCSIGPSLADTLAETDASATTNPSANFASSHVSSAPGTAALTAPLRPAIVTPAVSAPTQTTAGPDQTPRRHHRIGLPGLFHVNLD